MDEGPLHKLPTFGGLGLTLISWVLPSLWNMPKSLAWVLFSIGVLFILYGLWPLAVRLPFFKARKRLISLTDLLRHIELKHSSWAGDAAFIEQLGAELKQGGYDESLHFVGKSQKSGNDDATRRATLVRIAKEHWAEFEVCLLDVFVWTNTGQLSSVHTDNLRAATYIPSHPERKKETYADLHLVRSEAFKWLKNRANP